MTQNGVPVTGIDILMSAAKLNDSAPIALRRPALRRRSHSPGGLSFFGRFQSRFAAQFSFPIKTLRHRRRSANIAHDQDFDLEVSTFIPDVEHVTDLYFASRFCRLLVRLNSSQFAGAGGESASFEESRSPEPFVDARAAHDSTIITALRRGLKGPAKEIHRHIAPVVLITIGYSGLLEACKVVSGCWEAEVT